MATRRTEPVAAPAAPEPVPPLVAAAASGDRLAALQELRAVLAERLSRPRTAARDVAALSRQLVDVTAAIEDATQKQAATRERTPTDELAKRRAARRNATADVPKTTSRQPRSVNS